MFYLKYLFIKNKISMSYFSESILGERHLLLNKLTGEKDFKIEELEKIKDYFVSQGILNDDFDIGHFLDVIEENTKGEKDIE